jgi:hypothetical protein
MSSTGTAGGGTSASAGELQTLDEAPLSGAHWRWTAIAALGDYLDAGSIVAGGAALPLFTAYLHFGSTAVSLIAALGSNGVSTGIGALVAGRLGDRYGRKFIYSWDLLIYALGALVVALAVDAPMMIGGYMLLGLAVGIDVPTSWSLIAELAPRKQRGKLMAFTNIFWYIGPIVILLLALAFHPLGLLGGRLLFVSLLVVALAAWLLRRQLTESPRWSLQQGDVAEVEIALGRANLHKLAARPIDIDVLAVDEEYAHPQLAERFYNLLPLAEIAPGLREPATHATVGDLAASLAPNGVRRKTRTLHFAADRQDETPDVRLSLSRVGVSGVRRVMRLNVDGKERVYNGEFTMVADLAPDKAGVHMSRFGEILEEAALDVLARPDAPARIERVVEAIAREIVRSQSKGAAEEVANA